MQYAPHEAWKPSCGACRSYAKEAMLAASAETVAAAVSCVFVVCISRGGYYLSASLTASLGTIVSWKV